MAFQQGLSGLNAASKALDVTSNNVANAATVGFKSAQAHFADVFAASLGGGGSTAVGIGTSVSAIQQQFTQGNITTTNNPLDISINGGGFYRMSDSGSITYSRAGQFHLDKEGFVVDDQARQLTGYPELAGTIIASSPAPLQLNSANIDPNITTSVKANLNFNSSAPVITTPAFTFTPGPGGIGGQIDPLSYNFSTSTAIYDSLGNAHTLSIYARKGPGATPASSPWLIYTAVDGTDPANVTGSGSIAFDSTGKLVIPAPPNGLLNLSVNLAQVMIGQGKTNIATTPLPFTLDFANSTQFGAAFATNSLQQDGYTSGRLTGVSVGSDGIVRGNYSNGQAQDLGQVVLANFTNPNGLNSLGGNQWAETSASGPALVGVPNSGSLGVLQSAAVEESNVDLTAELVNMITEQRNYQANAQSIKTQDAILQTLVNLR